MKLCTTYRCDPRLSILWILTIAICSGGRSYVYLCIYVLSKIDYLYYLLHICVLSKMNYLSIDIPHYISIYEILYMYIRGGGGEAGAGGCV